MANSIGIGMIKMYVQSNLTSLHGSINDVKIDRVKSTGEDYQIEGTFGIPWDDDYSFSMVIDSRGNMKDYERKVLE